MQIKRWVLTHFLITCIVISYTNSADNKCCRWKLPFIWPRIRIFNKLVWKKPKNQWKINHWLYWNYCSKNLKSFLRSFLKASHISLLNNNKELQYVLFYQNYILAIHGIAIFEINREVPHATLNFIRFMHCCIVLEFSHH